MDEKLDVILRETGEPYSLPEAEITAIKRVVEATPGIDHRLLYIAVVTPTKVEVTTGVAHDPEAGEGNRVTLERAEGQWRVDMKNILSWIS